MSSTPGALSPIGPVTPAAVHASLRAARGRRDAAQAALAVAAPAAALVAAALWAWPGAVPVVGSCGALATLLGACAGWWRSRRAPVAELLAGLPVRDRPRILGDELATWLELSRQQRLSAPMAQWLDADLGRELAAVDLRQAPRVQVVRRRLRFLLPVAVLLVLAWWILHLGLPPWPGALGGGVAASAGGAGQQQSGPPDGASGGAPQPVPPAGPGDPQELPPPPPEPKPDPAPPVPPAKPAPLLELPTTEGFTVPQFQDDGPTRKALAHQALIEDGGGNQPPPPGGNGQPGGGEPPPPRSTPEDYARAAERAQQARHVPPAEQPIVRRFFELLQRNTR